VRQSNVPVCNYSFNLVELSQVSGI
jgi:hypothetical protein